MKGCDTPQWAYMVWDGLSVSGLSWGKINIVLTLVTMGLYGLQWSGDVWPNWEKVASPDVERVGIK